MEHEGIERAFLAELEALEKFRISYTAQYPAVPLSHDDPDVRRLIEAMAFFTARTRVAAMRGLDESVQRIFRQHFPALLGPSPAMAMLRAAPDARFTETIELPRGTEVLLRKPADEDEPERIFRFRTLASLRLLPLRVARVDMVPRRQGGQRVLIRLVANNPSNQELNSLSFHVNHLDDLRSSITVLYELKAHLESASVLYDGKAPEDAVGKPCNVSFGLPREDGGLPDAFEDPLQRARLRLRFPRQDLFFDVSGLRPPRNWQYVTICLDLKDTWPRKLRLTSQGFELHTVPMLNVSRALANPIECDGTKDRYPIRHPDEQGKFVPLWVVGAYRPTREGFVPLEPGVVGGEGDSYDVVATGQGEDRRLWAMLELAGAFQKPEAISIDAFWHQPCLRAVEAPELRVGLEAHFVDGVSWSCSGGVVTDADSEIDDDRDAQLELVSLKTLRFLGRSELLALLRACGAHKEALFAKLVGAIDGVKVREKPLGRRSHGLKYTYELTFGMLEPSDIPRLGLFCGWLLELLTTWSADEVLEILASVPNLDQELHYG
jgi:type VI secretion system protein ImpG